MRERQQQIWCEAIRLVPMKWRAEFCRFVDGGDASPEFLRFLDASSNAQRACELIFRHDEFMNQVMAGRHLQ